MKLGYGKILFLTYSTICLDYSCYFFNLGRTNISARNIRLEDRERSGNSPFIHFSQ